MQVLTSDFTNARANLHRALRLYRQLGDRAGQSDVLGYLGDIASLTAEYRQALSRYQHALTMCREVGNMRGEANALNGIGAVRFATGDCHAAAAMLEQALSLFRAIGDASGEGEVLVRMALVHIVSGGLRGGRRDTEPGHGHEHGTREPVLAGLGDHRDRDGAGAWLATIKRRQPAARQPLTSSASSACRPAKQAR